MGVRSYRILDNAFGWIADFEQAQKLANQFSVEVLHCKLDEFADRYCPVIRQFGLTYHWSLDQVEFATDVVFVAAKISLPPTPARRGGTAMPRKRSLSLTVEEVQRLMNGGGIGNGARRSKRSCG